MESLEASFGACCYGGIRVPEVLFGVSDTQGVYITTCRVCQNQYDIRDILRALGARPNHERVYTLFGGSGEALRNLGMLYLHGRGLPQSVDLSADALYEAFMLFHDIPAAHDFLRLYGQTKLLRARQLRSRLESITHPEELKLSKFVHAAQMLFRRADYKIEQLQALRRRLPSIRHAQQLVKAYLSYEHSTLNELRRRRRNQPLYTQRSNGTKAGLDSERNSADQGKEDQDRALINDERDAIKRRMNLAESLRMAQNVPQPLSERIIELYVELVELHAQCNIVGTLTSPVVVQGREPSDSATCPKDSSDSTGSGTAAAAAAVTTLHREVFNFDDEVDSNLDLPETSNYVIGNRYLPDITTCYRWLIDLDPTARTASMIMNCLFTAHAYGNLYPIDSSLFFRCLELALPAGSIGATFYYALGLILGRAVPSFPSIPPLQARTPTACIGVKSPSPQSVEFESTVVEVKDEASMATDVKNATDPSILDDSDEFVKVSRSPVDDDTNVIFETEYTVRAILADTQNHPQYLSMILDSDVDAQIKTAFVEATSQRKSAFLLSALVDHRDCWSIPVLRHIAKTALLSEIRREVETQRRLTTEWAYSSSLRCVAAACKVLQKNPLTPMIETRLSSVNGDRKADLGILLEATELHPYLRRFPRPWCVAPKWAACSLCGTTGRCVCLQAPKSLKLSHVPDVSKALTIASQSLRFVDTPDLVRVRMGIRILCLVRKALLARFLSLPQLNKPHGLMSRIFRDSEVNRVYLSGILQPVLTFPEISPHLSEVEPEFAQDLTTLCGQINSDPRNVLVRFGILLGLQLRAGIRHTLSRKAPSFEEVQEKLRTHHAFNPKLEGDASSLHGEIQPAFLTACYQTALELGMKDDVLPDIMPVSTMMLTMLNQRNEHSSWKAFLHEGSFRDTITATYRDRADQFNAPSGPILLHRLQQVIFGTFFSPDLDSITSEEQVKYYLAYATSYSPDQNGRDTYEIEASIEWALTGTPCLVDDGSDLLYAFNDVNALIRHELTVISYWVGSEDPNRIEEKSSEVMEVELGGTPDEFNQAVTLLAPESELDPAYLRHSLLEGRTGRRQLMPLLPYLGMMCLKFPLGDESIRHLRAHIHCARARWHHNRLRWAQMYLGLRQPESALRVLFYSCLTEPAAAQAVRQIVRALFRNPGPALTAMSTASHVMAKTGSIPPTLAKLRDIRLQDSRAFGFAESVHGAHEFPMVYGIVSAIGSRPYQYPTSVPGTERAEATYHQYFGDVAIAADDCKPLGRFGLRILRDAAVYSNFPTVALAYITTVQEIVIPEYDQCLRELEERVCRALTRRKIRNDKLKERLDAMRLLPSCNTEELHELLIELELLLDPYIDIPLDQVDFDRHREEMRRRTAREFVRRSFLLSDQTTSPEMAKDEVRYVNRTGVKNVHSGIHIATRFDLSGSRTTGSIYAVPSWTQTVLESPSVESLHHADFLFVNRRPVIRNLRRYPMFSFDDPGAGKKPKEGVDPFYGSLVTPDTCPYGWTTVEPQFGESAMRHRDAHFLPDSVMVRRFAEDVDGGSTPTLYLRYLLRALRYDEARNDKVVHYSYRVRSKPSNRADELYSQLLKLPTAILHEAGLPEDASPSAISRRVQELEKHLESTLNRRPSSFEDQYMPAGWAHVMSLARDIASAEMMATSLLPLCYAWVESMPQLENQQRLTAEDYRKFISEHWPAATWGEPISGDPSHALIPVMSDWNVFLIIGFLAYIGSSFANPLHSTRPYGGDALAPRPFTGGSMFASARALLVAAQCEAIQALAKLCSSGKDIPPKALSFAGELLGRPVPQYEWLLRCQDPIQMSRVLSPFLTSLKSLGLEWATNSSQRKVMVQLVSASTSARLWDVLNGPDLAAKRRREYEGAIGTPYLIAPPPLSMSYEGNTTATHPFDVDPYNEDAEQEVDFIWKTPLTSASFFKWMRRSLSFDLTRPWLDFVTTNPFNAFTTLGNREADETICMEDFTQALARISIPPNSSALTMPRDTLLTETDYATSVFGAQEFKARWPVSRASLFVDFKYVAPQLRTILSRIPNRRGKESEKLASKFLVLPHAAIRNRVFPSEIFAALRDFGEGVSVTRMRSVWENVKKRESFLKSHPELLPEVNNTMYLLAYGRNADSAYTQFISKEVESQRSLQQEGRNRKVELTSYGQEFLISLGILLERFPQAVNYAKPIVELMAQHHYATTAQIGLFEVASGKNKGEPIHPVLDLPIHNAHNITYLPAWTEIADIRIALLHETHRLKSGKPEPYDLHPEVAKISQQMRVIGLLARESICGWIHDSAFLPNYWSTAIAIEETRKLAGLPDPSCLGQPHKVEERDASGQCKSSTSLSLRQRILQEFRPSDTLRTGWTGVYRDRVDRLGVVYDSLSRMYGAYRAMNLECSQHEVLKLRRSIIEPLGTLIRYVHMQVSKEHDIADQLTEVMTRIMTQQAYKPDTRYMKYEQACPLTLLLGLRVSTLHEFSFVNMREILMLCAKRLSGDGAGYDAVYQRKFSPTSPSTAEYEVLYPWVYAMMTYGTSVYSEEYYIAQSIWAMYCAQRRRMRLVSISNVPLYRTMLLSHMYFLESRYGKLLDQCADILSKPLNEAIESMEISELLRSNPKPDISVGENYDPMQRATLLTNLSGDVDFMLAADSIPLAAVLNEIENPSSEPLPALPPPDEMRELFGADRLTAAEGVLVTQNPFLTSMVLSKFSPSPSTESSSIWSCLIPSKLDGVIMAGLATLVTALHYLRPSDR